MAAAVLHNKTLEITNPKFIVTSSGTSGWHDGEGAHHLSEKTWKAAGYTFEQLKEEAIARFAELEKIYRDAKAGNTKLVERRNTDPTLTKEADVFMRKAAKDDPAGDWSAGYMYTYVHGRDWGVIYTNASKTTVKARSIAIIGVATSNEQEGKCFYQPGWLQQDWNGTSFGPTYFSGYGGGKVHLNCENATLYK